MSLVQSLKTLFVGKKTNDVIDEVKRVCQSHRCTVEIQDPTFNTGNIDFDNTRVNMIQDDDGIVRDFKVG